MLVTVLVDFVILTRNGEVPKASAVVAEGWEQRGFFSSCKDTCEVTTVSDESGTTFPRMAFCECVVDLLVQDLSADFATVSDLRFALGELRHVEAPDLTRPADGHDTLLTLMRAPPAGAARAPGRITVWVADDLPAGPGFSLEGSTYLSQVLTKDEPGAGMVLLAGVSRGGRRLSHEVGHIVGFHHTAGEGLDFEYTVDLCGDVAWPVLQHPTCELNIMGGWYDGPHCCPSPGASSTGCEPMTAGKFGEQYCCGDLCKHQCPDERPQMTFHTPEHEAVMREIAACWAAHINTTDVKPFPFSFYVEDPPRRKLHMLRRVQLF